MATVTITISDAESESGKTTNVSVLSDPPFPEHEAQLTTAQVVSWVLLDNLNKLHEMSENADAELSEVQEPN